MTATLWYGIVGAVFVLMALGGSLLRRLPISSSLLYLLVGIGIGPAGLGLLRLDPLTDAGRMVNGVRRGIDVLGSNPRVDATALQTVGIKGWDGFALAVIR